MPLSQQVLAMIVDLSVFTKANYALLDDYILTSRFINSKKSFRLLSFRDVKYNIITIAKDIFVT